MSEKLRRDLASLRQEIANLKDEINKLKMESRSLIKEKSEISSRISELRLEAANLKNKRDALNEDVRNLKATLIELKREYGENLNSLRELRQKIREYSRFKPSRSRESLEKEIAELDWKIQTTPLTIDEEKKIIERVKTLEEQLSFYRKLEAMRNEVSMLEGRLKEIKDKITICRDKIVKTAEESRVFHERMVKCFKKIGELKTKMNEINGKYMRNKNEMLSLRLKYIELVSRASAIRKYIKEEEERKRIEVISALKEKIKKEALEKLKRGEKISFEEFKILSEDEII